MKVKNLKRLIVSFLAIGTSIVCNAQDWLEEEVYTNKSSDGGVVLGIIALVLAILAAVVAVVAFLKSNTLSDEQRKHQSKLKKLEGITLESAEIHQLKFEIENLKKQVAKQNVTASPYEEKTAYRSHSDYEPPREIHPSQSSNTKNGETYERRQAESDNSRVESDLRVPQRSNIEEKRDFQESSETRIFVGVPLNDTFTLKYNQFIPGKCLYEIITSDGETGKLQFVNRNEALGIAKRNLSQYIESVCVINGRTPNAFSSIVTLKPGKVRFVDNGWQIEEKALIEYR